MMLEESGGAEEPFTSLDEIPDQKTEIKINNNNEGNVNTTNYSTTEFTLNKEKKVLSNIFSNFNVIELSRASRVCKVWKEVSEKDDLWKRFLPSSIHNAILPNGVTWKRLYLNRRKEFILTCKQNFGIFIRLDNDTYTASQGGDISGEVVINLEKEDKLLAPVTLRFIGYEESFENHTIIVESNKDLEIGSFSRRHNYSRQSFPVDLYRGINSFPFSMRLPTTDTDGTLLPPSVTYIWEDTIIDNETYNMEYLLLAKAQLASQVQASSSSTPSFFGQNFSKKSKLINILPSWNPHQKFSRIRFGNTENVYTSRFPFANIKLRASLQQHPTVNDNNLDFEISLEVENFNTSISGPITVTLFHTAESTEFVAPELHADRTKREFPANFPKSAEGHPPLKKKITISIPQREFWVDKIRGPPPAYAKCVYTFLVEMKVSIFTTISASLPIEFLEDDESNTEKEQDLNRPVVDLE